MKKRATGVLLVLLVCGLMGCHARTAFQEEPLKPMAQYYRGTLPCMACGDIEAALFLDEGGSFIMQERYPSGRDSHTTISQVGRWSRTAERLVLTDSYGEKRYFRPRDNGLEALGDDGQPLHAQPGYRLLTVEANPVVRNVPLRIGNTLSLQTLSLQTLSLQTLSLQTLSLQTLSSGRSWLMPVACLQQRLDINNSTYLITAGQVVISAPADEGLNAYPRVLLSSYVHHAGRPSGSAAL
ncbi:MULTISPECIES: copper resistance protein NlpE N-terminal domain-containing protein [Dickeya]|uniref:Copper homeostasis protein CutF / Lipoprotein NlpE involeved in surface adhesion n=1 Tax=Dickeya aquatica TaxID=1401087 RepID=A0A375AEU7_9GAMM|nr:MULTISPECIES: copper resistance protein NlpE N-terminal domain-containing protein [Dickeya]SLM64119.1 Copper homeostasis protein CutF precursor / Lipoprotein NlpE involeved in surface adhesion [Dickeya aquatica]